MSKLLKVAAGLVALVSLAIPAFADEARQADGETSAAKLKVYYDTNTVYAQDACVNLTIVALKEDGSVANNADAQGTILRAVVETTLGVVDANTTAIVEKGYGGAKVKESASSQGLGGAYAKAKTTGVATSATTAKMIQSMVNHKSAIGDVNPYKSTRGGADALSISNAVDTTVFSNLSKTAVVAIESGIGAVAVYYPTFEGTAVKTDTITVRLQKRYSTLYSGSAVDEIASKSDISITVNPPKYTAKGFALVDTDGTDNDNSYYVLTSDTDPYVKTLKTKGTTTSLKMTAGYGKGYIQALALSTAPDTATSKIRALNNGTGQGTFVGTVTATFSYNKSDANKIYNTDATATADKTFTGAMTYLGNSDYVAKIEIAEGSFTAAGVWNISLSATVNGAAVTTTNCGTITVLARPHSSDKPWKVTTKCDRPVVAKCSTAATPARPNLIVDMTDNYGNLLRYNSTLGQDTLGSGAGPIADYIENMFATGDTTLNLTFKKDASNTTATALNISDISTLPAITPVVPTVALTSESALTWTTAVDTGAGTLEKAVSITDSGNNMTLVNTATVATVVLYGDNGTAAGRTGHGLDDDNNTGASSVYDVVGNKDVVGSAYNAVYGVTNYANTIKVGTDDVVDYKVTKWTPVSAATYAALPKADIIITGAAAFADGNNVILKNASGTLIILEADDTGDGTAGDFTASVATYANAYLLLVDYNITGVSGNADYFLARLKALYDANTVLKTVQTGAWTNSTAKLSDFFTLSAVTTNGGNNTGSDDSINATWTTAYATAAAATAMYDSFTTGKVTIAGQNAGGLVYTVAERQEISAPANVIDSAVSDKPFVNGTAMTLEVYNAKNVYKYTMTSSTVGYSVSNTGTLVADTGLLRNLVFQKEIEAGDYAIVYPTLKTYGACKLLLQDLLNNTDPAAGSTTTFGEGTADTYYGQLTKRVNLYSVFAVADVDATASAIKATVTSGTTPCVEFTSITAKDGSAAAIADANLATTKLIGGNAVTITVTTTYGNKVQISNDYGSWTDQSGAITLGTSNSGYDPAKLRIRVTYEDASDIGKEDTVTFTYANLVGSSTSDAFKVNVTSVENKLEAITCTGQKTCPVNGELLLKLKGTTTGGTAVATDSTASLANQIIISAMPAGGRLFDNCRGIGAYGSAEYYQSQCVGMETANSNDGIRFLTFKAPTTAGSYTIKFTTGVGTLESIFPIEVVAATDDTTTLADGTSTDNSPTVTVTSAGSVTSVAKGSTLQMTATITNYTGTETYTWNSSNEAVATVNGSGLVTALAAGQTTIKATGANSGKFGTFVLTVTDATTAVVTVTPATASVEVGATTTLAASTMTGTTPTTETYTWTSSNESVATVAGGVVTGKAAGTATITATGVTSTKTATATITVTAPVATTTSLYCPVVFRLSGAGNATVVVNVANIGSVDVTDLMVTLASGGSNTGVSLAAGKSTQIDLTAITSLTDIDAFTLSYKSTGDAEIIAEAQSTLIPFGLAFASPVQAAVTTSTASSFWLKGGDFLSIGAIFNPGTTQATYNVTVAGSPETVIVPAGKMGFYAGPIGTSIGAVRIEPVSGASYVATTVVTNLAGTMGAFGFDAGATTVKGGLSANTFVATAAATSAATTANGKALGALGFDLLASATSVTADAAIVADQLLPVGTWIAVLPMTSSATVSGASYASGMKLVMFNAGTTQASVTVTLYGATATDSKDFTVAAGTSVTKTISSTTVSKGAWVISGSDNIYATGYGVDANGALYTSVGK